VAVLPISGVHTATDLAHAVQAASQGSHCAFQILALAPTNAEVSSDLFLSYRHGMCTFSLSTLQRIFSQLNSHHRITTDATGIQLASLLFLASMHATRLHVTGVDNEEDFHLLVAAKEKHAIISFDVQLAAFLQHFNVIFQHMDVVDALSVRLDDDSIAQQMRQLLQLVEHSKLHMDDVVRCLRTRPAELFNLALSDDKVDLELNGTGVANRVQVQGKLVVLDGVVRTAPGSGAQLATLPIKEQERTRTVSFVAPAQKVEAKHILENMEIPAQLTTYVISTLLTCVEHCLQSHSKTHPFPKSTSCPPSNSTSNKSTFSLPSHKKSTSSWVATVAWTSSKVTCYATCFTNLRRAPRAPLRPP
jgi:hypothetical protein